MPSLCTGVTFKPLGNREGKAMLNEVRRTARAWNLRSAVHGTYILTAMHSFCTVHVKVVNSYLFFFVYLKRMKRRCINEVRGARSLLFFLCAGPIQHSIRFWRRKVKCEAFFACLPTSCPRAKRTGATLRGRKAKCEANGRYMRQEGKEKRG